MGDGEGGSKFVTVNSLVVRGLRGCLHKSGTAVVGLKLQFFSFFVPRKLLMYKSRNGY